MCYLRHVIEQFCMAEHNLLGDKGEMLASRYLLDKGFAMLHYNWRCGHKEIDLIARDRDTLVFVEVKSRRDESYGNAYDAVTPQKIERLISAAEVYIARPSIYFSDVLTGVGFLALFQGIFPTRGSNPGLPHCGQML